MNKVIQNSVKSGMRKGAYSIKKRQNDARGASTLQFRD